MSLCMRLLKAAPGLMRCLRALWPAMIAKAPPDPLEELGTLTQPLTTKPWQNGAHCPGDGEGCALSAALVHYGKLRCQAVVRQALA